MKNIEEDTNARRFLSDRTYDLVKYIVWGVLPTLGTLYFILAIVWGFPSAKEVLGSVVVIQSACNVLLTISSDAYKKSGAEYSGTILITESSDKTLYSLELDDDPAVLDQKEKVIFRVEKRGYPSRDSSQPKHRM